MNLTRRLGFGAMWLGLFSMLLNSRGQEPLQTIIQNGPTANRVNIVLLSEGYRAAELDQFLERAASLVNDILSSPPFTEYRSYFNAFAIPVASNESGSDHPSRGIFRDTYFNSTFDSFGVARLLTIPPNDLDADFSHGEGKVNDLLEARMPEYDIVIIAVNDVEYGSSGGEVLITSKTSSAAEIVTHEMGHGLAGLGDEYADEYPDYPDIEEPNTTRETRREFIKWNEWIAPSTPVPTPAPPASFNYLKVIGLFEGAHYQPTGWYRPKFNCKMRNLGQPFCEICAEALVTSAYQRLEIIEGRTPTEGEINITRAGPFTLSLSLLQPATHNLTVSWFDNGSPFSGASGPSMQFSAESLGNGPHRIDAEVRDDTRLVRNDPEQALLASQSWDVNISLTDLILEPGSLQLSADGRFQFRLSGHAPQGFVIQASNDLAHWIPLVTNTLAGGEFQFTDPSSPQFSHRFYRALEKQ